jgi:predicted ribosome quality control (RQC) complex YloA/Tae2 family protein
VSFHLKTDPQGALQYGLIAEEVNKIYPELVIRDGSGKIQGVRYDELAPMLLNEMQQQQRINASQADEIRILKLEHEEMRTQLAELSDLKQELRAALRQLQSKGELIAQR